MRLGSCLAGTAVALALMCSAARAGPAFTVGNGSSPDVAMDPTGAAHVVWRERTSSTDYVIHSCRIPAGATACTGTQSLETLQTIDDPLIVIGDALYVIVPHYVTNSVDIFTSTDGGASFGAPATITEADPSNNQLAGTTSEDAVFGPGNSLSITTWNPGEYFLNVPTPVTAGRAQAADFSTPFVYNFSVALSGSTPITTAWEIPGGSPTQFAAWAPTGPNLDDAANWGGPFTVGQGEEVALAGGPSGVFALSTANGSQSFPNLWEVRRFTGSGFGPPQTIATNETSSCGSCDDLFQDAKGALYAAWRGASSTVRLSTSSNGTTFTAPYDVAREDVSVAIANVHVAAVPGGNGLVVYDQNGDSGQVKAANLTALPPPPPVLGVSADVAVVRGTVLVKVPTHTRQAGKGTGFVPLTQARQIPVGSILDTSHGTVALTSAANAAGGTQTGSFTAGLFQLLQARTAKPVTDLRLTGGSFSGCGKTASAARRKKLGPKTIRQLRGDVKGNFRTSGRYAAATVRGTAWTMADRCDGTLTRVRRGVVVVRDTRRHRTITVRAGKSYLARAP